MPNPLTRKAIIEAIARDICAEEYGRDPDEMVDSLHAEGQEPLWTNFVNEAEEQLERVGKYAAVVPREADERLGYVGGTAFEEAAFANQKIVFRAAQDVWQTMVSAADLTQERT